MTYNAHSSNHWLCWECKKSEGRSQSKPAVCPPQLRWTETSSRNVTNADWIQPSRNTVSTLPWEPAAEVGVETGPEGVPRPMVQIPSSYSRKKWDTKEKQVRLSHTKSVCVCMYACVHACVCGVGVGGVGGGSSISFLCSLYKILCIFLDNICVILSNRH